MSERFERHEVFEVPIGRDWGEGTRGETAWEAAVQWDTDGDRFVPVAVEVRNLRGEPVTPEVWRKVKIAEIIRASRDLLEAGTLILSVSNDPATRRDARVVRAALSRGTGGYPPKHYAAVGEAYMAAVKRNDSQPVKAVLRALRVDYPALGESTVKGWIRTAKQRGHITETARPRRSGSDTRGKR